MKFPSFIVGISCGMLGVVWLQRGHVIITGMPDLMLIPMTAIALMLAVLLASEP